MKGVMKILIDNACSVKGLSKRAGGGILPLYMLNLIFSEKYNMEDTALYYIPVSTRCYSDNHNLSIQAKGKLNSAIGNYNTLKNKSKQDILRRDTNNETRYRR